MRRFVILPAVAYATACSLRPFTPSVSVAYTAEDVPPSREVALPSSREVAARWDLAPSDPWARYQKSTLVSSIDALGGTEKKADLPDVLRLDVLGETSRAAAALAAAGLPADTLWILDMRGAASVVFASELARHSKDVVSPVVTFNNWPAEDGVVPADETLSALITYAPPKRAPENAGGHPVFLLDAWRLAYREDDPGGAYDNRYMLAPTDFPSAEELRARVITRVVYVVENLDDTEGEEDDLHPVLRRYQAAGIGVHFVDLGWLEGLAKRPQPIDWARTLAPVGAWIPPRRTLQDDPLFYARARGGFGAAYGMPIFGPHYGRGFGGYRGYGGYGGRSGGGFGGG